jgi:phospholipase/carboxylesterase
MPLIAMHLKPAVLSHSRLGTRPQMNQSLPHLQTDQFPPAEAIRELVTRSLEIPCVQSKQSRMASPDTHALYLPDELAEGPPEAFIDGHEFCHVHPFPQGTIHLTLPKPLREGVVRLSWGEPHPIAESGILRTLLTVYAPRDREETQTVLALIVQSCLFAQGKLPGFGGPERSLREAR